MEKMFKRTSAMICRGWNLLIPQKVHLKIDQQTSYTNNHHVQYLQDLRGSSALYHKRSRQALNDSTDNIG
jgi:hypothetical protein